VLIRIADVPSREPVTCGHFGVDNGPFRGHDYLIQVRCKMRCDIRDATKRNALGITAPSVLQKTDRRKLRVIAALVASTHAFVMLKSP
jgi:hypothetical protein